MTCTTPKEHFDIPELRDSIPLDQFTPCGKSIRVTDTVRRVTGKTRSKPDREIVAQNPRNPIVEVAEAAKGIPISTLLAVLLVLIGVGVVIGGTMRKQG